MNEQILHVVYKSLKQTNNKMKKLLSFRPNKNFFILLTIFLALLIRTYSQSECHTSRFPQTIPMLYGEQSTINLQQYITGPNITYSVEPNDFHSNIQPQYSCRNVWSYQLGRIIATQEYQVGSGDGKETFLAMLGGSKYFGDVFFVYYNVSVGGGEGKKRRKEGEGKSSRDEGEGEGKSKVGQIEGNEDWLKADNIEVLQVPRHLLKDCKHLTITPTPSPTSPLTTLLTITLDCMSLTNPLTRILTTTTVPSLSPPPPSPSWQHLQSPIYLPPDIVLKLTHINTDISIIQTSSSMRYLVRTIMTEYADYIEVWRWTVEGKEVVGVYDTGYFVQETGGKVEDVDIRQVQVVGDTVVVLDLINGLHVLRLNNQGKLQYKAQLQIESFTTFHYSPTQHLLFMGKKGQIQQYQLNLLSPTNIKATRIQRYHLHGFEQLTQITVQNRFLYATTNQFIHVIHLTNIQSNYQEYDGSYNVYGELYTQRLIPTVVGFVKVVATEESVRVDVCETHPPFLHLKAPNPSANFTIHAKSTLNQGSTHCELHVQTVMVPADDDHIYPNGYEAENETIFSNRPGRTLVELQKYGIGRNIDYDLILFNHQIPFNHSFRKVNNQSCEFTGRRGQQVSSTLQSDDSVKASSAYKTHSTGNWLIVEYPQNRVKEYYKCAKYQKITCTFIHLTIIPSTNSLSTYQLIEEQRTKREYLQQAILYVIGNQSTIEVSLASATGGKNESIKDDSSQNSDITKLLCKIKFPQGEEYKVGEFKLREDKLYVVLPYLKEVRVYEALFSLEQNQQCHYFGNINASSFSSSSSSASSSTLGYFSPQHIDFDKHSLSIPYLIPSFQQSFLTLTPGSSTTLFLTQFNELLIIHLTFGPSTITRTQLIRSITLDRLNEGADVKLIVTLPYVLGVDYLQQKTIAQYYFTHTYEAYFIRSLGFWSDEKSMGSVRLVDANTIAVITAPESIGQQPYAQVYQLNSIVSSFKQYARWRVPSLFHVMSFTSDSYQFVTITIEQTPTTLQMSCSSTTLTPTPVLILDVRQRTNDDQPSKQQFYLAMSTSLQSKRHIMTLEVASDSSQIEKGQEYPYRTFKVRIEEDQEEKYFEIDDSKWFEGNIWTQRYVCADCKTGRVRFEDKVKLEAQVELQVDNKPSEFYVHERGNQSGDGLGSWSFETVQGYLNTKITPQDKNRTWLFGQWMVGDQGNQGIDVDRTSSENNNNTSGISYTFSQTTILSSNTENDPSCIKASPSTHNLYFASLCSDYQYLDNSAILQLRLYSNHGFKPFVIYEYLLQVQLFASLYKTIKAGTKSYKQLIIMPSSLNPSQEEDRFDTVFVRFDDNIWVFLVIGGRLELIYTVDKVDFGGDHLCWVEVVKKLVSKDGIIGGDAFMNEEKNAEQKIVQYGIMASMCETGLYYIVFTVDHPNPSVLTTQKQPLPSFHRIAEQHIDMPALLLKNKIQLPQHSYFLQTITKPLSQTQQQANTFLLYMIIENFNSFIWEVTTLRDTITISSMSLVGVIKRYNEYSPIQVTSDDGRYFSVLYKSTQNQNVSEFLAMYDTNHFVMNQEVKEYNMFSVERTNQSPGNKDKSEVQQVGSRLFVLTGNVIRILNATNLIRMHVQKSMPKVDGTMMKSGDSEQRDVADGSVQLQSQSRSSHPTLPTTSSTQPPTLYTQSIIIFVQTPTQVNSVTIKLQSIDFFQLSGWQITFIVIGGLLGLLILYYVSKQLWRYYQKKRKLVKLETDSVDDRSSEKRSEGRSGEEDGGFQQEEDEEEIRRRNGHGRESQITTSDSPSILEPRKELDQPLIGE